MSALSGDPRVVLTLDAGGTKFTFNAMRSGRLLLEPLTLPSRADDLDACLEQVRAGFDASMPVQPAYISRSISRSSRTY